MLRIEIVTLRELRPQLTKLAEIAYKHVSIYKDKHKLDINWQAYEGFEKLGLLVLLGVYNEKNTLVGFAAIIRSPAIHAKGVTLGIVQTLYIHPKYRKTGIGVKSAGTLLLEEIELVAKATKCTYVVLGVPKEEKRFCSLLINRGYSVKELNFMLKV